MCVGNGECDIGREGNWCATCMDRWFAMNSKCMECPDNSAPMVVAAVCMFLGLSFAVVNIATTKKGGGKAQSSSIVKEVGATPMSILFTRLQISLPVFKLGMSWPLWLQGWFSFFKGMISLDVSAMTAPECFTTGDPAAMYLLRGICIHNTSHNLHLILGLNYTYISPGVGIYRGRSRSYSCFLCSACR